MNAECIWVGRLRVVLALVQQILEHLIVSAREVVAVEDLQRKYKYYHKSCWGQLTSASFEKSVQHTACSPFIVEHPHVLVNLGHPDRMRHWAVKADGEL